MRNNRFGFSGENTSLEEIDEEYKITNRAIRRYFASEDIERDAEFFGMTPNEIQDKMSDSLAKYDLLASMNVLSCIEAAFRIDYIVRTKKRLKDPVSLALRDIYKSKENRASFADDILSAWRAAAPDNGDIFNSLKSAQKYRHWLAHGRYWVRKHGGSYDYLSLYVLAKSVFDSQELETHISS